MAKYVEGTIRAYIEDASAGRSTPGGGSISALAGAIGASMAQMAANFTVGKKKFADVEEEVKGLLDGISGEAELLLACVDEDVAAYGAVSAAYSMPRASDDEKKARSEAIQKALVTAMAPPMKVVRACGAIADVLDRLAAVCNPMLISDVGVAAAIVKGALLGARLNVDINLSSLKDAQLKSSTAAQLNSLVSQASQKLDQTYDIVAERLGGK